MGVEYVTIAFAWDKQLPVIGHYTHSQVELCLIASVASPLKASPSHMFHEMTMQFVSVLKRARICQTGCRLNIG